MENFFLSANFLFIWKFAPSSISEASPSFALVGEAVHSFIDHFVQKDWAEKIAAQLYYIVIILIMIIIISFTWWYFFFFYILRSCATWAIQDSGCNVPFNNRPQKIFNCHEIRRIIALLTATIINRQK